MSPVHFRAGAFPRDGGHCRRLSLELLQESFEGIRIAAENHVRWGNDEYRTIGAALE